jgi:hypothetical protein
MKAIVLGIDPSGSFKEGKGTTGFCILDAESYSIIRSAELSAKSFTCQEDYWFAHIQYILDLQKEFDGDILLSIEDYVLYGNKASSQVNSSMETSQLIGVIKVACRTNDIRYTIRNASIAKARWTNEILEKLGHVTKKGNRYTNSVGQRMNAHKLDSLRHALHAAHFENKEEKWY